MKPVDQEEPIICFDCGMSRWCTRESFVCQSCLSMHAVEPPIPIQSFPDAPNKLSPRRGVARLAQILWWIPHMDLLHRRLAGTAGHWSGSEYCRIFPQLCSCLTCQHAGIHAQKIDFIKFTAENPYGE